MSLEESRIITKKQWAEYQECKRLVEALADDFYRNPLNEHPGTKLKEFADWAKEIKAGKQ